MYSVGDKIFYGQTGVCIIEDIAEKEITRGVKRLYYTLKPIYQQNNLIFAPVENSKVFMCEIITEAEAREFISRVPELCKTEAEIQSEDDYKSILEKHTCEDLLKLAVKIHTKKLTAKANKKKLGFVDEKYLRRAEDLLFGELATVLNTTPEEIPNILFGNI